MGLGRHLVPAARTMRRVRMRRRRVLAELVATSVLMLAGIVGAIIAGGALAHVVWRLILWGWES